MTEVAFKRGPHVNRDGHDATPNLPDDADLVNVGKLGRAAGDADRFQRANIAAGSEGARTLHFADYRELIPVRTLHGDGHLGHDISILWLQGHSDHAFEFGWQQPGSHDLTDKGKPE